MRIAYVNGRYLSHSAGTVHIEDRGFQFADGVYEVIYRHQGRLMEAELHLARLQRSLGELRIAAPVGQAALRVILEEVAARNRLASGLIYMQITRGVARREHVFPPPGTRPSLVVTMRRGVPPPADIALWSGTAITLPDQRWARCDIKSVSLLPNVLAKQAARERGAMEAILFDAADMVTEGASTSVWIVDSEGVLRTRALSEHILPGCTRAALLEEIAASGQSVEDRPFSLVELRAAREIFLTAATAFVKPIVKLDGNLVGDGKPGPVATYMFRLLADRMRGGRNS